ncbi:MAG TPA: GC-type dockerin domain-anchored protein [Phycisphaerales bacterium]|nr:GC-type dockerin domain-anchored protein [Phycisphaerales bacterium]
MFTKTTRTGPCCLLAAFAVAAAALAAHAQTNVPRGGAVVKVGAGSAQVIVKVRNTTGDKAEDVTIGLEGVGKTGTLIKEADVLGRNDDSVDDDGDGVLQDDENDTVVDPADTVAKCILKSPGSIANDETIEIKIVFTGKTPEGTQLRIKFSTERDGVHCDMLEFASLGDDDSGVVEVTTGAAQIATGVVNAGHEPIAGLMLNSREPYFDPYMPPECSVDRPAESWMDADGTLRIAFEAPLLPGEAAGIYLILPLPVLSEQESFKIEIRPWMPHWSCPADFNGDTVVNTLDVLAFLNAYTSGDAAADFNHDGVINTLDVLAFLNAYTADCECPDGCD